MEKGLKRTRKDVVYHILKRMENTTQEHGDACQLLGKKQDEVEEEQQKMASVCFSFMWSDEEVELHLCVTINYKSYIFEKKCSRPLL